MSQRIVLLAVICLLIWSCSRSDKPAPAAQNVSPAAASGTAAADPFQQRLEEIVARYRKTIVLLEDGETLPDADRERVSLVGRVIFQENHQALSNLSNELTGEIEKAGDFSQPLPQVARFLDLIETQQDLHDADKLSFREVFADIAEMLSGIKSTAPAKLALESRVDSDRQALTEIQSLYEKELDKIFGRFNTRGMAVRREAWDRYVAYLHTKYKREDILKSYEAVISRIGLSSKQAKLHADSDVETFGDKLPPKTFLLTFDDGPHPRYTDRILEILKKYKIKSVFFELGTNLGVLKHNKVEPTRAASAARHLVEAGFTVGSHGFSHSVMPKMSDQEVAVELDETNRMLETVAHVHTTLFRPPYGERDAKVLAAVEAHKMKSILWNVDSKDWADPVAKSIANRVIAEARKLNHGIILLHDIHERTIEAVPLIIETLNNEGFRFLSWNGQSFVEDAEQLVQAPPDAETPSLYHESWAVVVGIDNYPKWPRLQYAVNDANGIKEILLRKFKFKPDHVITLLNEEATREKILSALGDTLSNPSNVQRDDRVFVFFAGHGATRKLPSGRDLGYIVPVDADSQNFQGQSISMTNFQDISESIPAKHVFFVMDSCYSGLGFTRGAASSNYLQEVARRTARQMLTAGGANEEVADNGPNGHSVFTWTLLQGLEGRADLNSDGYVSAAELAAYVGPGVSALSHQTPAFGNLPGSEGGEFIFELHPETEFLGQLSTQLDQEAIRLNSELDRIRKDIAGKTARNEQLRKQLEAAKLQQTKLGITPAPKPKDTAARHITQGNALFKEKRYPEALSEFLAATKMDPGNAQATNNVGFTYYKMDKFDDAAAWYEKTIAIAPRRAIAYANLGDLYYQLNKTPDARRAYEKYLELVPASDEYASTVRLRLGR